MFKTILKLTATLCVVLFVTGCASLTEAGKHTSNETVSTPQASDTSALESYNKGMYKFNNAVDKAVISPIAKAYEKVVPSPIRSGIHNFFSNIRDIPIALNNLMQGKVKAAGSDVGRLVVNTTVGLLGVVDVASNMGLEKHNEDFGQTFGKWGIPQGPYVVLPILGPSSIRDGVGLVGDIWVDPVLQINDVATRNTLSATRLVDDRQAILKATDVMDEAALDGYSAQKDAWLQRRDWLVKDGNVDIQDESE